MYGGGEKSKKTKKKKNKGVPLQRFNSIKKSLKNH